MKYAITTAKDRYDKGIRVRSVSWSKLAEKLQTFRITDETFDEYINSPSMDQLQTKDVGWYIGGPMDPCKRRKANLQHRSILTLDIDHLDSFEVEGFLDVYRERGLDFVLHSSHKHTDDAPRLRLVLPFSEPVPVDQYEPIARMVASWGGIDYFDDTTYQVSRVMFWPSRSKDGDELALRHEGKPLDPAEVLELYEDWQDWGSWPTSTREEKLSRDPTKKAEDPYTKPGVIGAFNRLYSVPHAIAEFELPYEPSGMGEDRYTYLGGSSADGAIYYEDDGHLYSWHESDPARGNHNAFDLVRLHRFAELDSDAPDGTGIGSLPSQKAMVAFAGEDEDVAAELAAEEFPDDPDDEAKEEQGLTYNAIRKLIHAREEPLTDKQRRAIIVKIAAARLTPSEVSILAATIKSACADPQPTKQSVLDEIKVTTKQLTAKVATDGGIADLELELINEMLREWYAGGAHLKRFARQFWSYEGGVWLRREDEHVRSKLQRTFTRLRTERPEELAELVAVVGEGTTSATTSKLWQMFCAHLNGLDESTDPMHLMQMDVKPVINCRNGEIHFNRKGQWKFTPHHPELFLTSQLPLDWDPDADTSEWDNFCEILFHDSFEPEDDIRHLEEVGGFLMQQWRELPTFLLMRGEPLAGKSTFGRVVNQMLGAASVNKDINGFDGQNSHAEAGLVGKLMLLDEDFNRGLLPAGFIKRISEAKQLTANPKGKDEFEFICRAIAFVICNDWPPSRDHSGALERRLVCWNLKAIPEHLQDNAARDRLLKEGMQGVLRRFVDGFARVYQRGDWELPANCIEAARDWQTNTDIVRVWAALLVHKKGNLLARPDCYGWFSQWYRDTNPGHPGIGKREFDRRLERILGGPTKRNGVWGWADLFFSAEE